MPGFAYKGRDAQGAVSQGTIDAPDAPSAADLLVSRGILPVDIQPAAVRQSLLNLFDVRRRAISAEDIMFFSRQMHTLMKAGVPILQALAGLRDSATHPAFAEMLGRLRDSLDSGRELSIALREVEVFGPFYVSMVRVGEMTGRLDKIFLTLFDHLNFEKEMRAKIKAALRYPTFVVIALAAALVVINWMVIPAFSKVFATFNAQLPLMTRILIGFSDFCVNYWYLMLGGLLLCVFSARAWVRTSAGQLAWDRWKLSLPLVGETIRKATLARFARSFSLSLASGLPVMQAFSVVAKVVDNAYIAGKLEDMRRGVERGESILRTAASARIFTPIVLQMIAVGEESDSLDDLLLEIAEMYEREVDYEVDNLSARIEPVLVVVLGAIVLVMALGIFLPIWDLSSAMLRPH
ncbi:MAG: MSHA biogenesis protein MshG [Candidatus Dactylopiibacterium carminicum]|uniref:MSHA biogenesis protein MshG n=1 Tax=Candidatus Dactylopiibacterium carminicum TaxID=857335 RepID=A0A272EMR7_9RHOO|nr:type II secretion system F family protein [Candidatus Dactylopiibacterium carminicum]KAF7597824.1 type II secretion system F family protein [Candidatus Dactylopiibacterium carminicum]PAS91403.1 MAG: MSHA biogenesis protein MshG [Candidatus Dactylopiibacterium carminicum]PAS92422.1 MAG: MSHA biogenesis protein MshG [Candidatus Dactylopiibacterium carminicum]PAS95650.1 MAG: MSHA biogenesis protein MshG [Candidatus Dactylopiibacterium carminicum]